MDTNFFDTNSFFIDEKVNFLKFENAYQVFDDKGENIGIIAQKMSGDQKAAQLVAGKGIMPFHLDIKDKNDKVLASVKRGTTLFLSKISVVDNEGKKIGEIHQKFSFKPKFKVFNAANEQIGEAKGNFRAWNFVINDNSGNPMGKIDKKWAGAAKEIFTSADKYNVNIDPAYNNTENKIIVLATAITIDMVMKSKK